jgi:hypothetical protein
MATPAQHLWLVKLLGYDYEIEYRKGRWNMAIDTLSRISSKELYALNVSTTSTSIIKEIRRSLGKDYFI